MRVGSVRWWFENRNTGEVTIAQFPNWPLWGVGATWALTALAGPTSDLGSVAAWIRAGLWIYWGGDELLRGVNPWRRALGVAVLGWQTVTILWG